MTTRADTFHLLQGHVKVANSSNPVTASRLESKQRYKYDAATHAVNKFASQGKPNVLAQTFQFNHRSGSSPIENNPVMMLR